GRNYQVDDKTQYRGEVGADIKYSITPSMTLDLTYNTDFAQVEVDEQQVNLDRFNLFFPEKRPFFLENAGQFSVGSPGEVDLFFSRRIGIGTSRQRVPIIGGARLSGKLNKTNVGFLSMFTEEVPAADLGGGDSTDYIQPNNFTVARVNHEFAPRSAIGAILVNRQGMGSQDEDYNRTYAIDGRWGLGKKAQVSGFYAQTATPGVEEGNHAFKLQTRYEWNGLIVNGAYTEVGEGFNPEVGFLLRPSFHKPEFLILQRIRPKKGQLGLLELRPHVSYRSYWGREGFLQTSFLHIDNHWEWKNGFEVHTGINFTVEGVQDEFEIFEGIYVPQGTYRHNEAQIVIITNPSKPVSIRTRHILGGFFGGKRYANSGTLGLRIGDQFNSEFGLSRNDIRLPNGNFSTTIFRGRLSYSFTPLIFAQSLIQYNSVLKLWSANVRFGWLQRSNSGLFLVYNQVQDELGINSRSFTIKYSHVFDMLK
ncbi:MAG: hydrolase, partial [Bacteroidetes bacterium]